MHDHINSPLTCYFKFPIDIFDTSDYKWITSLRNKRKTNWTEREKIRKWNSTETKFRKFHTEIFIHIWWDFRIFFPLYFSLDDLRFSHTPRFHLHTNDFDFYIANAFLMIHKETIWFWFSIGFTGNKLYDFLQRTLKHHTKRNFFSLKIGILSIVGDERFISCLLRSVPLTNDTLCRIAAQFY